MKIHLPLCAIRLENFSVDFLCAFKQNEFKFNFFLLSVWSEICCQILGISFIQWTEAEKKNREIKLRKNFLTTKTWMKSRKRYQQWKAIWEKKKYDQQQQETNHNNLMHWEWKIIGKKEVTTITTTAAAAKKRHLLTLSVPHNKCAQWEQKMLTSSQFVSLCIVILQVWCESKIEICWWIFIQPTLLTHTIYNQHN